MLDVGLMDLMMLSLQDRLVEIALMVFLSHNLSDLSEHRFLRCFSRMT